MAVPSLKLEQQLQGMAWQQEAWLGSQWTRDEHMPLSHKWMTDSKPVPRRFHGRACVECSRARIAGGALPSLRRVDGSLPSDSGCWVSALRLSVTVSA